MNKNYEVIHDLLCDLEKKIIKKGDVDPAELEYLYKLSSIITDYETREAMKKEEIKKEEMKGGYSQHYPPYMWQDRMSGYSYDGMSRGDYSEEGSYRRGRDANTGRYVSRDSSYEGSYDGSYDRYSREEAEDQMKQKLMQMMSEAKTDKAKDALRQAIDGLR